MSISDGQLANATNFNAAFISKTSQGSGQIINTVSKTADYTATISDGLIYCDATSAALTITLYTAVGNAGRRIIIKRVDNTFANVITIDGNASETIDGNTTRTMNTSREEWVLISDGSNWRVESHSVNTTPFAVTFTGTWSSNTTYTGTCTRRGALALFNVGIALAGAPTSATLTLTMPTGMTLSTQMFDSGNGTKLIGTGFASDVGVATYPVSVYYASSTTVTVCAHVTSATYATTSDVTQAVPFTFGSGDGLRLMFECSMTGWLA